MRFGIVILLIIMVTGCKNTEEFKTLYVNSYRVDCVGVGPMKCLLVKSSLSDEWSNFYQNIEGFDFQPGYQYELKVSVETTSKKDTPADASNLKYKLVKEVSKQIDRSLRLNDIWLLQQIDGIDISKTDLLMEIQIPKKQILFKSFCNSVKGSISNVSDSTVTFKDLMSTKKICPDMESENKVSNYLLNVSRYIIENNKLKLLDETNQNVLTFRKVD